MSHHRREPSKCSSVLARKMCCKVQSAVGNLMLKRLHCSSHGFVLYKTSQILPEVEVYFPVLRVFNPHLINLGFHVQLLRRENNQNILY